MIKINKFQKSPNQRLICLERKIFKKSGFTLIEILVTLFVLSIGVSAVFLLMSKSLRSSMDARDQIIASQLAQEGIELVRNLKDNRELDAKDAVCDYTKEDGENDPHECSDLIIKETGEEKERKISLGKANGDEDMRLSLNGKNYYVHNLGVKETKFFRKIDLTIEGTFDPSDPTSSDRKITVTTYVTWNGSGFDAINNLSTDCNVGNKCLSIISVLADY